MANYPGNLIKVSHYALAWSLILYSFNKGPILKGRKIKIVEKL
jgi:hypothetical protein